MIHEIAKLTIDSANSDAFEKAVAAYIAKFSHLPGCSTMTVEREIEDARCYYLRAQWESVEAHLAMRDTDAGRYWREHVMPLYAVPSTTVHTQALSLR